MTLDDELSLTLARLVAGHDVLPFMGQLHTSTAVRLAPLPPDMATIVSSSPDFQPIVAGAPACWLQIASDAGVAELIVYRAASDNGLYVVAPVP